jgi:hypothetical protein
VREKEQEGEKSEEVARPRSLEGRPLLMTGADLLNGGPPVVTANSHRFDEGMLVRHPRYGLGSVIEVSRVSSRTNVTVKFTHDGRIQTFVAEKSPLQPVGVKDRADATTTESPVA